MKIYLLNQSLDFYYLVSNDPIDYPCLLLKGKPLRSVWKHLNCEFLKYDPDFKTHLRKGDFYFLRHEPVFTLKSKNTLGNLLNTQGELLKFSCDGEELFLFNTLALYPALDIDNSKIKYFANGDIMMVFKYIFVEKNIPLDKHIFKLFEQPTGQCFVTQTFVDCVKESNLLGFEFKLLYES